MSPFSGAEKSAYCEVSQAISPPVGEGNLTILFRDPGVLSKLRTLGRRVNEKCQRQRPGDIGPSERKVSGRKTGRLLMRQEEEEGPVGLDVTVLTAHHVNSALNPRQEKVLAGVGDSTHCRI